MPCALLQFRTPANPVRGIAVAALIGVTAVLVATCAETTSPPVAVALKFLQSPGSTAAGVPIGPQLQVALVDANGQTVTSATGQVSLALAGSPTGVTLLGTTTASAVNGVATFGDVRVTKAGEGYSLVASSGTLTGATSNPFSITPAPPSTLTFVLGPPSTVTALTAMPQLTVEIRDSVGNVSTANSDSVFIAIKPGTGSAGATLQGSLRVKAAGGVAVFTGVTIVADSGAPFLLTATAGSLSAQSAAFTVMPKAVAMQATASSPVGTVARFTVRSTLADSVYSGSIGSGLAKFGRFDDSTVVAVVPDVTPGTAAMRMPLATGLRAEGSMTVLAGAVIPNPTQTITSVLDSSASAVVGMAAPTGYGPSWTTDSTYLMQQIAAAKAAMPNLTDAERLELARLLLSSATGGGFVGLAGFRSSFVTANEQSTLESTCYAKFDTWVQTSESMRWAVAVQSNAGWDPVYLVKKLAGWYDDIRAYLDMSLGCAVLDPNAPVPDNQQTTEVDGTTWLTTSAQSRRLLSEDLGVVKPQTTLTKLGNYIEQELGIFSRLKKSFPSVPSFPGLTGEVLVPSVKVDPATVSLATSKIVSSGKEILVELTRDADRIGVRALTALDTDLPDVSFDFAFDRPLLKPAVRTAKATLKARPVLVLTDGSAIPSPFIIRPGARRQLKLASPAGQGVSGIDYSLMSVANVANAAISISIAGSTTENFTIAVASQADTGRTTFDVLYAGKKVQSLTVLLHEAVATIDITPDAPTILKGSTRQFTAVLRDANGATLTGRTVTWTSRATAILTIDANGLATAKDSGTAVISATSEGKTDTTVVSVVNSLPFAYSMLAAGIDHTCGLTLDGTAYCWGKNEDGQLGDSTVINRNTPVRVAGGLTFSAITAGARHTCALSGGTAYCWGYGASGRLGNGATANIRVPTPVSNGLVFSAIAAGNNHTCGLSGGLPYCWGAIPVADSTNIWGSETSATLPESYKPRLIKYTPGFISIASSGAASCALTAGGAVWCWGSADGGVLGRGTYTNTMPLMAATVAGANTYASLSTAGPATHMCALTSAGDAYCWGNNLRGQLGDSTQAERNAPTKVFTAVKFLSLAHGTYRTCGTTDGGVAYCWGEGDGRNSSYQSNLPKPVPGTYAFTRIITGWGQTCGLTSAGTAYCWGSNFYGQSGTGDNIDRYTPQAVKAP